MTVHKRSANINDNILFGDGERLSDDTSFQESGILDSTGFLELISFVEERFGIEIADSELVPENFDTVRKMSDFVEKRLAVKEAGSRNPQSTNPWRFRAETTACVASLASANSKTDRTWIWRSSGG